MTLRRTRLGHVANIAFGWPFESHRFSADPLTGRRVLRIRDLSSDADSIFTDEIPRQDVAVEPGDLLVGMDGDFDARLWRGSPALLNQRVARVRSAGDSDLRFIAYAIPKPLRDLNAVKYATTVKHLSAGDLRQLPIPSVPPEVQRRVADFLDRECDRISLLGQRLVQLVSTLNAQRGETFDRLTAGAPLIPVRYRLRSIGQGWSPECEATEAAPGEWGVLKVGCVNYGMFRATEHKRLPDSLEPRPATEVFTGDILMSRANTRELVGSAALVTDTAGRRLMMSDKLYRLVPTDAIRPAFLVEALLSRRVRDQIELATAGASSSMQNISQATIRELTIPDLTSSAQEGLMRAVAIEAEHKRAVVTVVTRANLGLAEYRDALITEAVTGQLDVSRLSDAQLDELAQAASEGERPEVLSA